ncbi:hypothetical protein B0H16DRAFT_1313357, partial [Mycena metata]
AHTAYANILLVVRPKDEEKGLSSAVLRGFEEAWGQSLVVIDTDLQHPPATLPTFFALLASPATPFRGTRYAPCTKTNANWPLYRIARARERPMGGVLFVIPWDHIPVYRIPLTVIIHKHLQFLASHPLTPTGFKIALELLLKAPIRQFSIDRGGNGRREEVGYSFGVRSEGSSKLGAKVGWLSCLLSIVHSPFILLPTRSIQLELFPH